MNITYPEPPAYLLAMPRKILFGTAKIIEPWLRENKKERPSLLELAAARRAVR